MSELKAYRVESCEFAVIVSAESAYKAAQIGANKLEIDIDEVSIIYRASEFDSYAISGDVPWRVLVEDHGWFLMCKECGTEVMEYSHDNREWIDDNSVICGEC